MPPLAFTFRPKDFDQFVGQQETVSIIKKLLKKNLIPSLIFWGPPGSGKTTLAHIISKHTKAEFITLSAVMDGKDDLKKVLIKAKRNRDGLVKNNTILFIDEIHRWNKAQQDALLPFIEDGLITLIGATTENPSFNINSALLSRCRVFTLSALSEEDIFKRLKMIIDEFKNDSKYVNVRVSENSLRYLAKVSNYDIRVALNILEMCIALSKRGIISVEIVKHASQKVLLYDKNGEEHYNLISAVHKSIRSGNGVAGAYWVVRMLKSGEDPLYIARRLIRFASEDVGNSKIGAIILANTVYDVCQKLGMPECQLALIQLVLYLAEAPRDNYAYRVEGIVEELVEQYGNLPVPMHFRNAPTKLMKDFGYGKGYQYEHLLKSKRSNQSCWPDKLEKIFEEEPLDIENFVPKHFR